jgi:hypothetical protein
VHFDNDPVKKYHPEILDHCGAYSFQKGQPLPVVDNQGWDMLWPVLFDYVSKSTASGTASNDRLREAIVKM